MNQIDMLEQIVCDLTLQLAQITTDKENLSRGHWGVGDTLLQTATESTTIHNSHLVPLPHYGQSA